MSSADTKYKLHYFNIRSRGEGARYLLHYASVSFEDKRLTFEQWGSRDFANLTGKDEFEAAECDEIADALEEVLKVAAQAEYSTDQKLKDELRERIKTRDYPRVLGHLECRLKANGSKHIVGNDWTWADITVAWYMKALRDYAVPLAHLLDSDYPTLVALQKSVEALPAIASYIAKRPESKW